MRHVEPILPDMLECAWECRVQTGSRGGPALASCRVSIAVATVMADRQQDYRYSAQKQEHLWRYSDNPVKLVCLEIYE